MYFFAFDGCILLLVQEMDGCKRPVRLHDVDLIHIGSVTESDALFREAVIDLVLNLIDRDHAVCGYTALDLQKKRVLNKVIRETADQLRFGEEPLLRGSSGKGRMRRLVVLVNESEKGTAQLIKGSKVPHVKGGHPLILHRTEPAFDLGLLCRRVRVAVTDGRPDPGGKKLHLTVLVGGTVVEAIPISE